MRRDIGILFIITSFAFAYMETDYFGWNLTAKSMAEMICDTISLTMDFFGIYLLVTKSKK